MRINTNVSSLTAQASATQTNKNLSSSLEKLSSGLAINKAADDAAGLSIADKLRTQASSLGQGISNGNSASALIQIADAAMSEQGDILDTVKTKLLQAATDTTTDDGREAIRKDVTKLLEQVDNIASQTNYNGITLLQNSATDTAVADEFTFQLGEDATFDVSLQQSSASNTASLGGGSDVFGATSVNNSVTAADITAANQVGASLDGSGTTHNNISTTGSQQLSSTGAVTLTAVAVAADGTEAAGANRVDISLSGQVGSVVAAVGIAVYDMSNQTQEIQDFAKNLASQDDGDIATGSYIYDAEKDQLTVAAGNSVAFGDLEVSSLRVNDTGTSANAAGTITSLTINAGGRENDAGNAISSTFTVQNEVGDRITDANAADTGADGQLNVSTTATSSGVTGGALLSDLKDLGEGELTNAKANEYLSTVDEAITQLDANRADFGSSQNQIESSIRSMTTAQVNLEAAESVIRDVDYAKESSEFSKQNIISQAGTYAMSQANSIQSNITKLLQ